MDLNLRVIADSIRKSSTTELLDRVTAYRTGMEPAALDLMEGELSQRGVTLEEMIAHENALLEQGLLIEGGVAWPCSRCDRPAIGRAWFWHRIAGWVPVFPMRLRYCYDHRPEGHLPAE